MAWPPQKAWSSMYVCMYVCMDVLVYLLFYFFPLCRCDYISKHYKCLAASLMQCPIPWILCMHSWHVRREGICPIMWISPLVNLCGSERGCCAAAVVGSLPVSKTDRIFLSRSFPIWPMRTSPVRWIDSVAGPGGWFERRWGVSYSTGQSCTRRHLITINFLVQKWVRDRGGWFF